MERKGGRRACWTLAALVDTGKYIHSSCCHSVQQILQVKNRIHSVLPNSLLGGMKDVMTFAFLDSWFS